MTVAAPVRYQGMVATEPESSRTDRSRWSRLDPMEWMDWVEDRFGSVATTGLRVVGLLVIGIATTDWLGWYAAAAVVGGGAVALFLHYRQRDL